jgi:hypothetical protein
LYLHCTICTLPASGTEHGTIGHFLIDILFRLNYGFSSFGIISSNYENLSYIVLFISQYSFIRYSNVILACENILESPELIVI